MSETELPNDTNGTDRPGPPEVTTREGAPYEMPVLRKLKTDVAFLVLGVFTPLVLTGAFIAVDALWLKSGILSSISLILFALAFFVLLAVFIWSHKAGRVKLWSFAKGALLAYLVIPLIVLLAFGTCLISLGNLGG